MHQLDLEQQTLREVNGILQAQSEGANETLWTIANPRGAHAIACGLDAEIDVTVKGSTGYYCGGMNERATIRVEGSVGPGWLARKASRSGG